MLSVDELNKTMLWASEAFFKGKLGDDLPAIPISISEENQEPLRIEKEQTDRIKGILHITDLESVSYDDIHQLGKYDINGITLYQTEIEQCAMVHSIPVDDLCLGVFFHELIHAWLDKSCFSNKFIELEEALAEMGALKLCRLLDESLYDKNKIVVAGKKNGTGISFYGYGAFLDEYTEKTSNPYYLLQRLYAVKENQQDLDHGENAGTIALAFRNQYPSNREIEIYNLIVSMLKSYIPVHEQ